jgi:hypothetical protein
MRKAARLGAIAAVALSCRLPARVAEVDSSIVVVDGVAGVEYTEADLAAAPQYEMNPTPLGVSTIDLFGLTDVSLLADNRIAALVDSGPRLLLLSAEAAHIRDLRADFRMPQGFVVTRGDSLLVLDGEGFRGEAFRVFWVPTGGAEGMARVRSTDDDAPDDNYALAGELPNGGVVLYSVGLAPTRKPDSLIYDTTHFRVLPPAGAASKVARVRGPVFVPMQVAIKAGLKVRTHIRPRFSAIPDAIVWDTLIVVSPDDRYRLHFLDRTGRVVGGITARRPRRPVTDSMHKAAVEADAAALREAMKNVVTVGGPPDWRRDIPSADSLPAIAYLELSSDGTLWVIDGVARGDTAWTATAFRKDGSLLARLRGTGKGLPVAFGADRVVIREDADGGSAVLRVHPITRQQPAPRVP